MRQKNPTPVKPAAARSAATVKSADRVLDILEAVSMAPGRISFSQLMDDLDIPRSSLFQLLGNLMARGYLEQDAATQRYLPGPRIADLARGRPAPQLPAVVLPLVEKLSQETNETAGFYLRDGDFVTAIATRTGGQALAYTMRVGEKAPLYAISSGKIVLAHMPDAEVRAYLARTSFEKITPQTLSSAKQVWEQVRTAREEGFAYAREEFTPGIIGIATAVLAGGRLAGTVNLAVPTVRYSRQNAALFRQRLRISAGLLGEAIEQAGLAG
ncbi:IclR family transcriptional regulator [Ferrovibrio sp.]|uniref:IclR family transcriptional regulator n=1 Tax=Ferrovibrio sp. TaxID=1917215 RepID=UPI003517A628